MNRALMTTSNVYYLPVTTSTVDTIRRQHQTTLSTRLQRTWWRLRFMATEISSILRRGGRQIFASDTIIFDSPSLPEPSRPRYSSPALVIDFESARERLQRRRAAEA